MSTVSSFNLSNNAIVASNLVEYSNNNQTPLTLYLTTGSTISPGLFADLSQNLPNTFTGSWQNTIRFGNAGGHSNFYAFGYVSSSAGYTSQITIPNYANDGTYLGYGNTFIFGPLRGTFGAGIWAITQSLSLSNGTPTNSSEKVGIWKSTNISSSANAISVGSINLGLNPLSSSSATLGPVAFNNEYLFLSFYGGSTNVGITSVTMSIGTSSVLTTPPFAFPITMATSSVGSTITATQFVENSSYTKKFNMNILGTLTAPNFIEG